MNFEVTQTFSPYTIFFIKITFRIEAAFPRRPPSSCSLKELLIFALAGVAKLVGALSHKPKSCRFWSLVRAHTWADGLICGWGMYGGNTINVSLSLPLSLSLSLSLKTMKKCPWVRIIKKRIAYILGLHYSKNSENSRASLYCLSILYLVCLLNPISSFLASPHFAKMDQETS